MVKALVFISIGEVVAVVIGVAIVIVFAMSTRGSGKTIECPECEYQFGRPAFAQRKYGVGVGPSQFGEFTCPKCGYKGEASSFRVVGGNDGKSV
jgi:predicted RNA-binding Zn-ribbon protein involved in translation (DUF1610 family)